nr:putative disease resistance RPP13-like protein 1 [Tanacetum cinerariifolium]
MADQRTMAELLCAPTEGYAEAILVPLILAEQFELKHSLINMMTSDQFFGQEKDNPHDHIRWFNKITSTIKYKDVPNSAIKLMLFPFSLTGAACRWLEKEPPRSILTWEDLDLAYDIDDVLDDLTTEAMRRHLNEEFHPSKKNCLRLNDIVKRSFKTSRRLEEISLVDGSRIVGQGGDKEALVGVLLENESCKENASVVSIVGLEGCNTPFLT